MIAPPIGVVLRVITMAVRVPTGAIVPAIGSLLAANLVVFTALVRSMRS